MEYSDKETPKAKPKAKSKKKKSTPNTPKTPANPLSAAAKYPGLSKSLFSSALGADVLLSP